MTSSGYVAISPREVKDMEDEIEGYETRVNKLTAEKNEQEDAIKAYKDGCQRVREEDHQVRGAADGRSQ